MELREAMKMAVELAEVHLQDSDVLGEMATEVYTAFRAALAQPEQEPVAHVCRFEKNGRPDIAWDNCRDMKIGTKLYAIPPKREWQGLTDEELAEFSEQKLGSYDLCLEVEAKLREKNV